MEEWDIQYKELLSMPEQSYRLIDIRDEASMSYGMIPGAEWLPTETIEQNLDAADKEKMHAEGQRFESVILHSIGNVRNEDERSMTYCTSKQ